VSFTYTGLGWIGPFFGVIAGMSGGVFGAAYVSSTVGGAMFCAAAAVMLAAAITSSWGRTLNTQVTADGRRVLGDRHTADGLPLQDWWVVAALYATVCVVIGLWSIIGFRGILVGAGLLVLALLTGRWVRRRRTTDPARTADRTKLARERGWKLGKPAPALVNHWSRGPYEQDHHLGQRHGLTGELDGFPVTVFDSRPPRPFPDGRPQRKIARTVCIVRLPTGYGDPGATPVLTPEVLRLTSDRALAGWRLEGHDLALVLVGESYRSNAEVMAVLHGLVELARALPPGSADTGTADRATPDLDGD
jgi:hypothetical protein